MVANIVFQLAYYDLLFSSKCHKWIFHEKTTLFSLVTYAELLQSFGKPRPCNAHISKSNQEPMDGTKSPPNIIFYYFDNS